MRERILLHNWKKPAAHRFFFAETDLTGAARRLFDTLWHRYGLRYEMRHIHEFTGESRAAWIEAAAADRRYMRRWHLTPHPSMLGPVYRLADVQALLSLTFYQWPADRKQPGAGEAP